MDNLHLLSVYLQRVTSDIQLTSYHISLYTVLCQKWISNDCKSPFRISRSTVMKLARIQSKATYHKVIHKLIELGYITYRPSNDPIRGSKIYLVQKSR